MPIIVNICFNIFIFFNYLPNNCIYTYTHIIKGFSWYFMKGSEKVSNMHCHAVMRTRTHSDIV